MRMTERTCGVGLLLMVTAVLAFSSDKPGCETAVQTFLNSPNRQALGTLSHLPGDCWENIGDSNASLDHLNELVEKGNPWAAEYLARHLKQLDGGNLEDSLIALGLFSEHDMQRILLLAHNGLLSKRNLGDCLTMLPLTLADQPKAQLQVLNL